MGIEPSSNVSNGDDRRVPVTLLTGYLGAGKTTLVNHILSQEHGRRYAVVVNEFGDIGIDNDLILGSDEELFQMSNGCICCTIRGDLIRTLRDLLKQSGDLDGIIIETTGLADPGPVIQTFFVDQILMAQARLDSVTTVVDACHIEQQTAKSPEAIEQIAFADQVLINKVDLVSLDRLNGVKSLVSNLNPYAPIHDTINAAVDLKKVLERGGFDPTRIEQNVPQLSGDDSAHKHGCEEHGHGSHRNDDLTRNHIASSDISSLSLAVEPPLDFHRLQVWIGELLRIWGQDILRGKGIFSIKGEDRKLVFQSVHMLLDCHYLGSWSPGQARSSRLVFIGRNLHDMDIPGGLDACRAGH